MKLMYRIIYLLSKFLKKNVKSVQKTTFKVSKRTMFKVSKKNNVKSDPFA